jgi:hypothetical protein
MNFSLTKSILQVNEFKEGTQRAPFLHGLP